LSHRSRSFFVWIVILTLHVSARAQEPLSISGTVRDISGVLVGATVTLRDPGGATRKVITGVDGGYRFDSLRRGTYEVAATHEGFNVATRTLTLDDSARVADFSLQLAGFVSSVEVTDVAERSTAGGIDVENREIPNYVVSVSAKTLWEQGINDLPSALENVSGVTTQVQYGVYEWYTIGGITQQSGNDFLYIDGMKLTGNRMTTQLNNIEEVQVFKGPNSILYGGSGAGQGGMVNLIRKKPSAVRTHDMQYRIGGWGLQEFTGATTGAFFGSERWLYRLDASYSTRNGWRQNAADRLNLSPAITWLLSPSMRITANETFIHDDYKLDAGLRRELTTRDGMPFDVKMNPANDFQRSRDWQNQIVYAWTISQRFKLTNSLFTRRNRDQYLDAETMTYVPARDEVTRTYLYFQHNRRPVQEQADLQGNFRFLGFEHHTLARYEFENQFNYTYRTGNAPGTSNALNMPLPPVPVQGFIDGTWVDTAPAYDDFPITRVDYSTNRFQAVVLQDQFYPVEWLGANFTLRRGNYHRNAHNDTYDAGVFVSRGADTDITNNVKNNYRAGVALLPKETWASAVRGFSPYFSYNSSFNPVNQVQPDGTPLDPVENESFEVGNRWRGVDGRLSIMFAGRRLRDKNRVVNIGGGVFEQIGQTTTSNFDLDINGDVGAGFSVLAAYGYANSIIDPLRADGQPQVNGGLQFPNAPTHTGRLSVSKAIRLGSATGMRLNIGYRHVSEYFLNTANTLVMPPRDTIDAAVSVHRGQYDISLNLANLTNRSQYFVSQINSGGQLYPGQPFNATATIRYRFQ
jgi:iron complex outermembrane receptor protein